MLEHIDVKMKRILIPSENGKSWEREGIEVCTP